MDTSSPRGSTSDDSSLVDEYNSWRKTDSHSIKLREVRLIQLILSHCHLTKFFSYFFFRRGQTKMERLLLSLASKLLNRNSLFIVPRTTLTTATTTTFSLKLTQDFSCGATL